MWLCLMDSDSVIKTIGEGAGGAAGCFPGGRLFPTLPVQYNTVSAIQYSTAVGAFLAYGNRDLKPPQQLL